MKKYSLLTLALATFLGLVGCQNGKTSSPSSISEPSVSSSQVSSRTPSSRVSSSSSKPSVPVSSQSSSSEISSSSGELDKYPWDSSLADVMMLHLGGHVIPYFDAGSAPSITFNYKGTSNGYGYVDFITGIAYSQDAMAQLEDLFVKEGYTQSSSSHTFVNSTLGITILLTNTDSTLELQISYDEPYDSSTASGYDSDLLNEMDTDFETHTIPFVYLATAHNYSDVKWDEDTNKLTVYGGKWDDQVLTDATASLTGAGYAVQKEGTTLTATGTDTNGASFTITISSYSTITPKVKMDVLYRAPFTPETYSAWHKDIITEMQTDLDNHVLPFVYLGTDNPEPEFNDSQKRLTLTGSFWNDQVLTLANSAFTNDNQNVEAAYQWTVDTTTSDNYGKTVTANKTFEDGCSFSVVVGKNANGEKAKAQMVITYTPKLVIPATRTGWEADTAKAIKKNIGHDIPYVYLNVEDYTKIGETTSWTNSSRRNLSISGGYWNKHIIPNAVEAFTAANWTVEQIQGTYGIDFTATKVFDGEKENGDTITCTITTPYSQSSRAVMNIRKKEKYEKPTDAKDLAWPSAITKSMTDNFGSAAPFVYLGTNLYVYDFNENTSTLTVYGDTYDAQMETDFLAAYGASRDDSALNWSVVTTKNSYGNILTATATDSEGGEWYVVFQRNSYDTPYMNFNYRVPFDPDSFTAWPEDISNSIKTDWGDAASLPLVYLGTKAPTIYAKFSSSTGFMQIDGGMWNDQILTLAKKTYEDAGWTTQYGTWSYSRTLMAYKRFSDNSVVKTVLFRKSSSNNAKASLATYYSKAVTIDTTKDFTAAQKQTISSALLGNSIPFFLPDVPTTMLDRRNSSGNSDYDLSITVPGFSSKTGKTANLGYLLAAKDILDADGWTTSVDIQTSSSFSSSSSYASRLRATKTLADNKVLYLAYYFSSPTYGYVYVTLGSPYALPAVDKQVYDEGTQHQMTSYFGFVFPYVYLGKDSLYHNTFSYVTNEETFTGGIFDEQMFTQAEASFAADTAHTWTVYYDYTENKTLVATCSISATEHVVIKIWGKPYPNENLTVAMMKATIC